MHLTKEQVDGAYHRALQRVIDKEGAPGVHLVTYESHHTFRYVFAEEILKLVSCVSQRNDHDQSNSTA